MKGFCQHCGKELNGDEPFCPECGMPTGSAQPQPIYYSPPKRNGTTIAIIFVAVIAVLCIVGIAFLPMLIQDERTYTVTITFDEVGITLEDTSQYPGPPVAKNVYLNLYYQDSSGSHQLDTITLAKGYTYNSGAKAPFQKSVQIKVTGDPGKVLYSAYMYVERDYPGGIINDNVDIYKVDTTKITTEAPLYLGCTGVSFSQEDFSEDNSITFDGDSDPIGHIKMTFTTVMN